ncbi:hypothetical protein L1987_46558 [Smallanthus sonchifolius]|uniref:Uncharacterized protein n=1 Tax=Smallanthus sonchifolius TaxID=185202 RepID=A0ACB9FZH9_9ASTR|nr:hypothetical protein L1987_46558 [Smallanthus sonchifolius]
MLGEKFTGRTRFDEKELVRTSLGYEKPAKDLNNMMLLPDRGRKSLILVEEEKISEHTEMRRDLCWVKNADVLGVDVDYSR